jgi:hypothetical protein
MWLKNWLKRIFDCPDYIKEDCELFFYRNATVVNTFKDLLNPKLIKASYIGKLMFNKSEESLYLLVSNDYNK